MRNFDTHPILHNRELLRRYQVLDILLHTTCIQHGAPPSFRDLVVLMFKSDYKFRVALTTLRSLIEELVKEGLLVNQLGKYVDPDAVYYSRKIGVKLLK